MEQTIKIGESTIVLSASGEIKAFTGLSTIKRLTKEQEIELGKLIAKFIYEME